MREKEIKEYSMLTIFVIIFMLTLMVGSYITSLQTELKTICNSYTFNQQHIDEFNVCYKYQTILKP